MNGEVKELLHQVLDKLDGIEKRLDSLEERMDRADKKSDEQMNQIKHDLNLCILSLGANNVL